MKTILILFLFAIASAAAAVGLQACGKSSGLGVGGKVIISGSGS